MFLFDMLNEHVGNCGRDVTPAMQGCPDGFYKIFPEAFAGNVAGSSVAQHLTAK